MSEPPRRRRRVRTAGDSAPSPADLAELAAATTPVQDVEAEPAVDEKEAERGLRGLVGGGSSQVGVAAAMRARDATRPSDADLAHSGTNLTIIRRGWTPPPNAPKP
jgi:hypothetical protein